MTNMDLFREIGMIDEKYVIEAEAVKRSVLVNPIWRRSLATAACLCLCIGLYFSVQRLGFFQTDNDASTQMSVKEAAVERIEETAEAYALETAAEEEVQTAETASTQDKFAQGEIEEAKEEGIPVPESADVEVAKQTVSQDSADKAIRDLNAVQKRFAGYPDDVEALTEEGLVVNLHGNLKAGQEKLDDFISSTEAGKTAAIELVQFTVEGDPIFYYIHYDGSDFYVVMDYSRDAFAGSGEKVHEYEYKYLKVFEEQVEGGANVEILLTDEEDLSLEKHRSESNDSLCIMTYMK